MSEICRYIPGLGRPKRKRSDRWAGSSGVLPRVVETDSGHATAGLLSGGGEIRTLDGP